MAPASNPFGGGLDLESTVLGEYVLEHLDDGSIIIDDENPLLTGTEILHGDVVELHEFHKGFARDAAEFRAGYTESLKLAAVETPDDRLLADTADLRNLAGCEDGFRLPVPVFHGIKCFGHGGFILLVIPMMV